MTKVMVSDGNLDKALSRFKAKVAKSGVPSEIKKRKHYSKPGVERREAKKINTRNARKNARRNGR
ncbi:MAG: 30S ribosomal protein S21 [Bacilli bacterium]|nr:30S ribosomal protein S21 [Bacilli bacterium]